MFSSQSATRLLLLVLLFCCPVTASNTVDSGNTGTGTNPGNNILDQQRQQYAQALKMMRAGKWQAVRNSRETLADYPLYPYLIYADLRANLNYQRRAEITEYLQRYRGSVKAQHLRSSWLDYLAKKDRWQTYINYYDEATASTSQKCNRHLAQYRLNDKPAAISGGLAVWVQGKSQPKACDKLFGILIKAGHISEKLAWQRFNDALQRRNYQLARYTKRFLKSVKYRDLHQLYYQTSRNPVTIGQRHQFTTGTAEELALIEQGLTRLARRDAYAALKHWTRYQQSHELDHRAQANIVGAIIKGLYSQGHQIAADSYHVDHLQLLNQVLDGSITQWRVRQSLAQMNWADTRLWLSRLPADQQKQPLWRYWQIRSLEGDPATTASNQIDLLTRQLAKERDFYGFLASERIGAEYSINHNPVALNSLKLQQIAAMPAMKRARELQFHGDHMDANREWSDASKSFQTKDWLTAAILASQWRWHNKAIASLGTARYWDDIEIRFPLAYQPRLESVAKNVGIPSYTLFALARQESAFNPSATSSAGAMGMIQVMPATAKSTARKHKLPYRNKKQLHDPAINLPIGARYYSDLLARFDNNRILATAAYNAGPTRVDKWLRKTGGKLPFDVWITLIPFKETRSYVQNIMMYSVIYSRQLGLKPPMLVQAERETLL
jgi:soluble lytic murein transglycosylase